MWLALCFHWAGLSDSIQDPTMPTPLCTGGGIGVKRKPLSWPKPDQKGRPRKELTRGPRGEEKDE